MTAFPDVVPLPAELLRVGERVTWWCVPRGGYGFGYPVDATIIAVHRTRVTVRVKRRDGIVCDRRVSPSSLRARPEHKT